MLLFNVSVICYYVNVSIIVIMLMCLLHVFMSFCRKIISFYVM